MAFKKCNGMDDMECLVGHQYHCPECDVHITSLGLCPNCGVRYQCRDCGKLTDKLVYCFRCEKMICSSCFLSDRHETCLSEGGK